MFPDFEVVKRLFWLSYYLWSGGGPCHQLFIHLEAPLTVILKDREESQ